MFSFRVQYLTSLGCSKVLRPRFDALKILVTDSECTFTSGVGDGTLAGDRARSRPKTAYEEEEMILWEG